MSNHYYPQFFVNTISNLNTKQVGTTFSSFVNAIAPVGGINSQKVTSLNGIFNGKLNSIVNGSGQFFTFGKSPRARVLKALRQVQAGTLIL